MPASVSVVSRRASWSPLRTGTHSVTCTAVTVPVTSDCTSAENFGASVPTISTLSWKSARDAGATETATGGRPVSFAASAGAVSVGEPEHAAASSAAPAMRDG